MEGCTFRNIWTPQIDFDEKQMSKKDTKLCWKRQRNRSRKIWGKEGEHDQNTHEILK